MNIKSQILIEGCSGVLDSTCLIDMATMEKYKQELEIVKCIVSMITANSEELPDEIKDEKDFNIKIISNSFLMKIRNLYESEFEKVMFEIKEYNKHNEHRIKNIKTGDL